MEVRFRGRNNDHLCYYCKEPIKGDMITNYYDIVSCALPIGQEAHSRCVSALSAKNLVSKDEKNLRITDQFKFTGNQ